MAENWNRKTWRLAGPVILSNISLPLLGAVDIAVVGHLPGPQYVGAVAVGALIFTFIYHVMNFLRMGTTGLTAQALGAGNTAEVRAWLARAAALGLGISVLIVALQIPLMRLAVTIVGPSAEVEELATDYYLVRVWGAPAALGIYALTGWFFGIQNTRAALVLQVFMNGLNILLDLWFVLGLGWGVEGVAAATVIAEFSAVALGMVLVRSELLRIGGRWNFGQLRNTHRLKRMVRVNGDIFLRSIGVQVGLAVFTATGARMGDVELAANAVLLNLSFFMVYGLDGFANAVEALAGEAVGARNRRQFREAVGATLRWSVICAALFSLAFVVAGPQFINLMTGAPSVQAVANTYLIWVIAMPLVSVWCFHLDGVFIGATWTREMRDTMAISVAVYVASVLISVPAYGNHGLWFSFALFFALRGITLALRYPRLERRMEAS